jgi:hypothetical protein
MYDVCQCMYHDVSMYVCMSRYVRYVGMCVVYVCQGMSRYWYVCQYDVCISLAVCMYVCMYDVSDVCMYAYMSLVSAEALKPDIKELLKRLKIFFFRNLKYR